MTNKLPACVLLYFHRALGSLYLHVASRCCSTPARHKMLIWINLLDMCIPLPLDSLPLSVVNLCCISEQLTPPPAFFCRSWSLLQYEAWKERPHRHQLLRRRLYWRRSSPWQCLQRLLQWRWYFRIRSQPVLHGPRRQALRFKTMIVEAAFFCFNLRRFCRQPRKLELLWLRS